MKSAKVFLIIFSIFVSISAIDYAESSDEIDGKVWQSECENKKKQSSFDWETLYQCCERKKTECESSKKDEDEKKSCSEKMKSCVKKTYTFRK